ncbi:C-5 sterol desaturase [Orchesella cincta]|uniref:C-5 sterol desaturase n=1 Tax=Orchesella cincta TaxID=48709 RepID=A0A1D2M1S0_ORCCI|nr:C-5 sterol desaturase [Orchesella cincta]
MGGNAKNGVAKGKKKQLPPATVSSPDIVTRYLFWTDAHGETLAKLWKKVPANIGQLIVSLALFVFGLTVRGEWLLLAAYFAKYLQSGGGENYKEETDELLDSLSGWISIRFRGYVPVLIWSTIVSYVAYFGIGGFLHWYYYVNRRDKAEEWKCQPNNWLTPALERHEIMVGSISLVFGSAISAAFSTYIINGGGGTKVYFQPGDAGYLWLALQGPIIFMWQDYMTYIFHRVYHTPFLYKNFHKLHHTYKQPTAFSVTAIHPVEFVNMQLVLLLPIFILPVYWVTLVVLFSYIYYHGIVDHSGINFKRHWWQPWQPDCIFHDNHHQYFHVNFGFNMEIWDKLHGTMRRKDRIYNEDIYYGYGKKLDDATEEEMKVDREERYSENPLAHSENKNEYLLD